MQLEIFYSPYCRIKDYFFRTKWGILKWRQFASSSYCRIFWHFPILLESLQYQFPTKWGTVTSDENEHSPYCRFLIHFPILKEFCYIEMQQYGEFFQIWKKLQKPSVIKLNWQGNADANLEVQLEIVYSPYCRIKD